MKGDPLPDNNHVSRYCSPNKVENERPGTAAFVLSDKDGCLSVNWLEFWSNDLSVAVGRVQEESPLELKPNGRFAVLNVLKTKNAISALTKRQSTITHEPTDLVGSHAEVCGYTHEEFGVAAALALIVHSTHKVN